MSSNESSNDRYTVSDDTWTQLALQLDVEVAALRAVASVEANGSGFIGAGADGASPRPKILFEGHIFHRLTAGRFSADHPAISYPKWDRKKYTNASGEWQRLEAAVALDASAALQSASWGAFQIMGFNYALCGCESISQFVEMQHRDADSQVACFARFLSRPGSPLIGPLRRQQWAAFAKLYNGPGYAQNRYDEKMASAYEKFSAAADGAASKPTKAASKRRGRKASSAKSKVTDLPPGRPELPAPTTLIETGKKVAPKNRTRVLSVRADSIDLRDWEFRPAVGMAPREVCYNHDIRPVLDQGTTSACTGYALAIVIEYLLDRAQRHVEQISPHMIYSMARRYDEWADGEDFDSPEADTGSSLRGALKGWHLHGASAARLWPKPAMPDQHSDPKLDWWTDAIQRPMGAYYRISPNSIRDMHVAISEVGAIYASALAHDGWMQLLRTEPGHHPADSDELPLIERHRGRPDEGHAFAIVGYTKDGFIVHNSWGKNWGAGGLAVLGYSDWLDNAMDCWVAQLGSVTAEHEAIASAASLRVDGSSGRVFVSSNPMLAGHEISPFVINMENNGKLSQRGRFRTRPEDIEALLRNHLTHACSDWGIDASGTVDIAIYAHGGLNDEEAAAKSAVQWVPKLYGEKIFPVFLMWETGAMKTIFNILEDRLSKDAPAARGGWFDKLKETFGEWWNRRVETLARPIGRPLWSEMKDNAEKISSNKDSGIRQMFDAYSNLAKELKLPSIRLHLIGHSAGAIVHTYLGKAAVQAGFDVSSISLLAPAVRVDTFDSELGPLIVKRKTPVLVATLTDPAERSDKTCKPYGQSLLYLVSRSFEERQETPILGMERHLTPARAALPWGATMQTVASPSAEGSAQSWSSQERSRATEATTHGSIDDDRGVQNAVLALIKGRG